MLQQKLNYCLENVLINSCYSLTSCTQRAVGEVARTSPIVWNRSIGNHREECTDKYLAMFFAQFHCIDTMFHGERSRDSVEELPSTCTWQPTIFRFLSSLQLGWSRRLHFSFFFLFFLSISLVSLVLILRSSSMIRLDSEIALINKHSVPNCLFQYCCLVLLRILREFETN